MSDDEIFLNTYTENGSLTTNSITYPIVNSDIISISNIGGGGHWYNFKNSPGERIFIIDKYYDIEENISIFTHNKIDIINILGIKAYNSIIMNYEFEKFINDILKLKIREQKFKKILKQI